MARISVPSLIPGTVQEKRDQLIPELVNAINHYGLYARSNYVFTLFLAAILIIFSMVGLITGLLSALSPQSLGLIAAVPTIVAFIGSVYHPQQRANWHFTKKDRLNDLRRKLIYALPANATEADLSEIVKEWKAIDDEMNIIWEKGLTFDLGAQIRRNEGS